MNTQETILQLEGLKLKGMSECHKALQTLLVNEWPTVDLLVARLVEAETSTGISVARRRI